MRRSMLERVKRVLGWAWLGCWIGASVACDREGSPRVAAESGLVKRVGVLRPQASGEWGRLVQAGAEAMGQQLGLEVLAFEVAPPGQASDRTAVLRGKDGSAVGAWVVVASEDRELGGALQKMAQRGVPVVQVDGPVRGGLRLDLLASVGTNEALAGRRGGEEVVKLMGGAGRVFISRGTAGSSPAKEREAGFLELMRRQLNVQVVGEKVAGADSPDAVEAKSLQSKLDLSEVNAVFCTTPAATEGVLRALRKLGLARHTPIVGFESSPEALEGLRKKEVRALIVANPRSMGGEAVRLLGEHWKGTSVPPRVEVPVEVLTPQNVDSATALKWRKASE